MEKLSLLELNKRWSKFGSTCLLYNTWKTDSTFKCNKCLHVWDELPRLKHWCPECFPNRKGSGAKNTKLSQNNVTQKLLKKNIKMTGDYDGAHSPKEFICLVCNHKWTTVPCNILNSNRGCKPCAYKRNSKTMKLKYYDKPTILYTVYFPDFDVYKIGITTRGVKKRFEKDKGLVVEIINTTDYSTGKSAWEAEQLLHEKHSNSSYSGPRFLKSGHHECYTTLI